MFYNDYINGQSLPPKTLCFTFDDGPGKTPGNGFGPKTLEIANYLKKEGIMATFFVVGKFAALYPEIICEVKKLGHLVGNHTFDHPKNMLSYHVSGGDVGEQLYRTNALLGNWGSGRFTFFRPPYLDWSPILADVLNRDLGLTINNLGPIGWDIDLFDWGCWYGDFSPEQCSDMYLDDIIKRDHGIVLMHDSTADDDIVMGNNKTFEMIQILVQKLKDRSYQFIGLDLIPDIIDKSRVLIHLALLASNGKYISPQNLGGGKIKVDGPQINTWENLLIEKVKDGKVTIRAPNGQYFSPLGGGGGDVLANGNQCSNNEMLELIRIGPKRVAFRTIRGKYLSCENHDGGKLIASSDRITGLCIFMPMNLSH